MVKAIIMAKAEFLQMGTLDWEPLGWGPHAGDPRAGTTIFVLLYCIQHQEKLVLNSVPPKLGLTSTTLSLERDLAS